MNSLLGLEKQKVSKDINSYTFAFYGARKIGKSTLVHEMFGEDVLFIATEKRHKTLAGATVRYVNSWLDFTRVILDLKDERVKATYKIVCIDSVDKLNTMLEKYVAGQYKEAKLGEKKIPWGEDWTKASSEWESKLDLIESFGYNLCFVGHTKTKKMSIPLEDIDEKDIPLNSIITEDKKGKKFVEYEKEIPRIRESRAEVVDYMVDNVFHLGFGQETDNEAERVIHTRESAHWTAGSTFKDIDSTIPLDAKALKHAIGKAIGHVSEEYTKEEIETFEKPKFDYEAIMKEVKDLAVQYHKLGRIEEVNDIAHRILGEDASLSKATEDEVEGINACLLEMKDKF